MAFPEIYSFLNMYTNSIIMDSSSTVIALIGDKYMYLERYIQNIKPVSVNDLETKMSKIYYAHYLMCVLKRERL